MLLEWAVGVCCHPTEASLRWQQNTDLLRTSKWPALAWHTVACVVLLRWFSCGERHQQPQLT